MPRNKQTKKSWLWEFSKKIVWAITILYIVERIFAMVTILAKGIDSIDVFVQTGSEVFLSTVVAYCVKAGFENVTKIKKEDSEDGL